MSAFYMYAACIQHFYFLKFIMKTKAFYRLFELDSEKLLKKQHKEQRCKNEQIGRAVHFIF